MLRSYAPPDEAAVLALLRFLTPAYFAPEEGPDLLRYLREEREGYFVIERDSQVVAAGGYNLGFDGGKTARLSWDLVHPDWQGRGLGRQLVQHRLRALAEMPAVEWVVVRTSQLAGAFYAKQGFRLLRVEKDFWAKGFDLWEMGEEVKM